MKITIMSVRVPISPHIILRIVRKYCTKWEMVAVRQRARASTMLILDIIVARFALHLQ